MNRRSIKIIIGFLGVLITICGWGTGNADRYSFVYKLIAPKYRDAMHVIEKIKDAQVTDNIIFRKAIMVLHHFLNFLRKI